MSKALSLKIKDEIFAEVEEITKKMHTPRNAYINMALEYYNHLNRRKMLRKQLVAESKLVRENSLEVLEEFERFSEGFLGEEEYPE